MWYRKVANNKEYNNEILRDIARTKLDLCMESEDGVPP